MSRVWRAKDDNVMCFRECYSPSLLAGKYVGKDDPVMIVRAQHGLPALDEILVPFLYSFLVEG